MNSPQLLIDYNPSRENFAEHRLLIIQRKTQYSGSKHNTASMSALARVAGAGADDRV